MNVNHDLSRSDMNTALAACFVPVRGETEAKKAHLPVEQSKLVDTSDLYESDTSFQREPPGYWEKLPKPKQAAAPSRSVVPSAAEMGAHLRSRACEVVLAELREICNETWPTGSETFDPFHWVYEFFGNDSRIGNRRTQRGVQLLIEARIAGATVPRDLRNSFSTVCWQDLAASLTNLTKGASEKDFVRALRALLRSLPLPTHQEKNDRAYLRALFLPAMENMAARGHAGRVQFVLNAIDAQRPLWQRFTRSFLPTKR